MSSISFKISSGTSKTRVKEANEKASFWDSSFSESASMNLSDKIFGFQQAYDLMGNPLMPPPKLKRQ